MNKTALVTGGSHNIGQGIAIVLAAIYALAATGKLGPAWSKLKNGAQEMGAGLFGKSRK